MNSPLYFCVNRVMQVTSVDWSYFFSKNNTDRFNNAFNIWLTGISEIPVFEEVMIINQTNCSVVVGITQLDSKYWLLCIQPERSLSAYSKAFVSLDSNIDLSEMGNPQDIAASSLLKCLYIADSLGVWMVNATVSPLKATLFMTGIVASTLSVTPNVGVLAIDLCGRKVLYHHNGTTRRLDELNLLAQNGSIRHAVMKTDGNLIISEWRLHSIGITYRILKVSGLDVSNLQLQNSYDIYTSNQPTETTWIPHLAVNAEGHVIVADKYSHQVLLLDNQTGNKSVIHEYTNGDYPVRVCFDIATETLIVGMNSGIVRISIVKFKRVQTPNSDLNI